MRIWLCVIFCILTATGAQALDQTVQDMFGHQAATEGDLARLSRRFQVALIAGRWAPHYATRADMSYLLPMSLVTRQTRTDEIAFADRKGQLPIRTRVGNPLETLSLHKWRFDNALNTGHLRLPQIGDQIVSSAVLSNRGHTAHIRSIRRGALFSTTFVRWAPQREREAGA